jgi:hypothetical protein
VRTKIPFISYSNILYSAKKAANQGIDNADLERAQSAVDKVINIEQQLTCAPPVPEKDNKISARPSQNTVDLDTLVRQAWNAGSKSALRVSIKTVKFETSKEDKCLIAGRIGTVKLAQSARDNFLNYWQQQDSDSDDKESARTTSQTTPTSDSSSFSEFNPEELQKKIQEAWARGSNAALKVPLIINADGDDFKLNSIAFPKDANVKILRKGNVKRRHPIPPSFREEAIGVAI